MDESTINFDTTGNLNFVKFAPDTMNFQGIVLSSEDQRCGLLDSSLSQSQPLFIRKQAHVGGYREFMVFRRIEKAIWNQTKIIIFMQKLISALNSLASHAPYFKFTENFIQYLVSYGNLKQAPCRLETPIFPC